MDRPIIKLPIVVNMDIVESGNVYELEVNKVIDMDIVENRNVYELEVDKSLPIVVDMDIVESRNIYELEVNKLLNVFDLDVESKVVVKKYGAEEYEGEYIVTPLAYQEQTLNTKDKLCTNDIVVKEVPIWETSNLSGGKTAYIAGGILEYGD